MKRPCLIATEKQSKEFALVVDKKGIIGETLIRRLCKGIGVVYVGKKLPHGLPNIIHIPYSGKFPSIPQCYYSYIFVVDDGTKTTRKSLSKFADKAEQEDSEFIFVVQRQDVSEKQVIRIIGDVGRVRTVILGDVFGKALLYDHRTDTQVINKFIQHGLRDGKIKVKDDGLSVTYPVFLEDAVSGILETAFGSNESLRIFYLFPKHPPTEISLAHMIQRANPEVKIDFEKAKKQKDQKITLPPHGKYLLDDDYSLQNRIKEIFLKRTQDGDNDEIIKRSILNKNNFNPFPLAGFLSLVFLLLLPLILTLIFSFAGFRLLESAKENLYKGELTKAQRQFEFSQNLFLIANKTLAPLVVEAKVIGKSPKVDPLIKHISIGKNTSMSGVYLAESLNKFLGVFGAQTKDAKSDFSSAFHMLNESMVFLQRVEVEGRLPLGINQALQDFAPLINLGNTEILSNIFGFEGEKTYLILFQDNSELRPTGGFIRSYGLLTMRSGAVKNFSTHDVYDADSKLKGHVEPPFPIRRYTQQQHWYLKDSNFDIDFVKSASKSAFFLEVETDKKVDGVIAIDTSFIKQLASAIGYVYVADYNKSVAGKDFLRAVFNSLLTSTSSGKDLPYVSLARIVSYSLIEKHILLAFANPSVQDFFTVNNFSSFWDKRKELENVINDFVGINEANLAGNKVNYLVKRMVSNDVTIDSKGNVSANLVILYNNKSSHRDSRDPAGGDYRNYLRIILGNKAQILSISIDGKDQKIIDAITDPAIYESKSFVEPRGLEVEKITENGKSFFGFLVNVPTGKRKAISIKYSLAQPITLDKPSFSYSLSYFKQPGTEAYPFRLSIAYPLIFKPIEIPKEFEDKDGKISLIKNINSDEKIQARFSKK